MNRLCEFKAWPTHAIRRVGIRDIECLRCAQEGKVLQTWGRNTAVKHVEHCKSTNHAKDCTWSTCSKNHAGRWLVSATSGGKQQTAFSPKEDICVNLSKQPSVATFPKRS